MKGRSPMHIPASVVGVTVGPREQEIDARWLMAYAAGLGETQRQDVRELGQVVRREGGHRATPHP